MSEKQDNDDLEIGRDLLEFEREQRPALVELLIPLSLAIRVELELVRALRHALFPDSDPGLEADLWASPVLKTADVSAVVLLPEVRSALHKELATDKTMLQAAWRIVEEYHREMDDVILLEERATYLTLLGDSHLAQAELGRVLEALDNEKDQVKRQKLLRWIRSFLARLPGKLANTPAAIELGHRFDQESESPAASGIPKLASGTDRKTITLGLRRVPGGVWITCPPEPKALEFESPLTDPIHLELAWPTAEGWEEEIVDCPVILDQETAFSTKPRHVATPAGALTLRTVDQREARLGPEGDPPLLYIMAVPPTTETPEDMMKTMRDLGWRSERALNSVTPSRHRPIVWLLGPDQTPEFPTLSLKLQLDSIGFEVQDLNPDIVRPGDVARIEEILEEAAAAVCLIDSSSNDSDFFTSVFPLVDRWAREDREFLHLPVALSKEAMNRVNKSKFSVASEIIKPGTPERTIDQIRIALTSHLKKLRKSKNSSKFEFRARNFAADASMFLFDSVPTLFSYLDRFDSDDSSLPSDIEFTLSTSQPLLIGLSSPGSGPTSVERINLDSTPGIETSKPKARHLKQVLNESTLLNPTASPQTSNLRGALIKIESEHEQARIDEFLASRWTLSREESKRIASALVTIDGQPGFLYQEGFAWTSKQPNLTPPATTSIQVQSSEVSIQATLHRYNDHVAIYKLIDPPFNLEPLETGVQKLEREDRWTSIVETDPNSSFATAGIIRDPAVQGRENVSFALALRLPTDPGFNEDTRILAPMVRNGNLVGALTRIIPGADPGGEGDLAEAMSLDLLLELLQLPQRIELVDWDLMRPEGVWGPINTDFLNHDPNPSSPASAGEVRWGVGSPDGENFQLLYRREMVDLNSESTGSRSQVYRPNDARGILNEILPMTSESELDPVTNSFLQTMPEIPEAQLETLKAFANSITNSTGPILPGLHQQILGEEPGNDRDRRQPGHRGTVRSLAISSDGRLAITAGNSEPDRTIKIWDLRTGKLLQTLEDQAEGGGQTALALSKNGALALTSFGHDLRLWEIESGKQVDEWSVKYSDAPLIDAAFAGEHHVVACSNDHAVLIERTSGHIEPLGSGGTGHRAVAAMENGELLAVLREDGITIWFNQEGRLAISDESEDVGDLENDHLIFQRAPFRFAPDEALLFGSPLRVWIERLGVQHREQQQLANVADYAWDGTAVWTTSPGSFQIINPDGRPLTPELQCGGREISCLTISADGTTVLAADLDHHLWVWWLGNQESEAKQDKK